METTNTVTEGVKPTEVKPIEQPESEAKKTISKRVKELLMAKEQELVQREAEIKRKEEEIAEIITITQLGGKSEAGITKQEKPETAKEYAERVMSGKIHGQRK